MRPKILIVEDELLEAMYFEESLKSSGYDVVGIASTGNDAIRMVAEFEPDLVLMDIVLNGEMDGIEVAGYIKQDFDVPVVYLTAHPEKSAVDRAKLTTPYGYLIKPVNNNELENTVELALYKYQMEKKLENSKTNVFSKLKESESYYKAIFEHTGTATMILEEDQTISRANKECEKLSGYSREEIEGKKRWTEFVVKEDLEKMEKYHQKRRENPNETPPTYDFRLINKNGKIRNIHLDVGMIPGTKKSVASLNDFTDQREVEEALKESEKRYRDIFENAVEGIYQSTPEGYYISVNPAFAQMSGFDSPEEMMKDVNDIQNQLYANPEDRVKIKELLEKDGMIKDFEAEIIRKDRKKLWISINATQIEDDKGNIYYEGTTQDITERKTAEEELLFNNTVLEAQLDSTPDGVLVVDDESKIVLVNKRFKEFFNIPQYIIDTKEDKQMFQYALNKFKDPDSVMKIIRRIYADKNKEIQDQLETKNGRVFDRYSTALMDEKGHYYGRIWYLHDITQLRNAKNKLKASLEEKELLLKEIHHRVKNNLQIISSLLDLQEVYVKDDPTAVNVLIESQNRVMSMAMIHEMLYQSEDISQIKISDYIQRILSNLIDTYGAKNITTKINLDQIYLNIETAVPLGLITSELISNSLKYAYPKNEKGEISVSFTHKNRNFEQIISDKGVGIPEKINLNTESTLGLRLVQSLVNQLDGIIKLDRSQGTKYIIEFQELKYKKRL